MEALKLTVAILRYFVATSFDFNQVISLKSSRERGIFNCQ